MSGEEFTDALNYLDDDLILETDALRQGKRTLSRPKVIRWLVPAACLTLILGVWLRPVLPLGGGTAAENGMAPEYMMDSAVSESENPKQQCDCSMTEVVQEVNHGGIFLYIPEDWTYTLEDDEDSRYILLYHPKRAGVIRVGYDPAFGVCGTGLTEEETVIAGIRAVVGTYDGKRTWSFIGFLDEYRDYVVINDGADDWCAEALSWLESLKFDPQ